MIDFVLFYEHRARELESVCLLKEELLRRGYKVRVANTYFWRAFSTFHFTKPKVVVVPWLYGNKEVEFFNRFSVPLSKIVNLQCEQVYSSKVRKYGGAYPSGEARKAYHVCWGRKEKEALLNAGIDEKNLLLVGSIPTDFDRPVLAPFFYTKHSLAQKYSLDEEKTWILFVSSFSLVGVDKERLKTADKMTSTSSILAEISMESQKILLEWIEKYVKTHPHNVFIYRPHPSELGIPALWELEKKYMNFRVISGESVRQWIICCDKINNWCSTSISDAFFLGKEFSTLRPVTVPQEIDSEILVQEDFLVDYKAFEKYNDGLNNSYSSSSAEIIQQYYDFGQIPAYVRLANQLEDILKFGQEEDFSLAKGFYMPPKYWKQLRLSLFGWLVMFIPQIGNIIKSKSKSKKDFKEYIIRECKGVSREFSISCRKIRKIIC